MGSNQFFNDVEAAKIAVSMERNGLDFYRRMVKRADDPNVRRVFEQLADDEQKHVDVFEELESRLLEDADHEAYQDDETIDQYMRRLVDGHVFADSSSVARLAGEATSDIEALGVGMRAERDTMLFYQEMLNFTDSSAAREAFQRIVDEERRHLVLLADRSEHCENLRG